MPRIPHARPAIVAATLIFVLVLGSAGAAKAQIINPFGVNNGNTLSNQDFALGRAAVAKLLSDAPAVGKSEDWSNPATGNNGKVTIDSIFTEGSMPCRKLNSLINFSKQGSAPNILVFDVCKTSAGWRVAS